MGLSPQREGRLQLAAVLQALPAPGFERLCQRLLGEAGFVEVDVTGRSGDGAIDGHGILQAEQCKVALTKALS